MKSKTYLILGANGFIGSHLVDYFAEMSNTKIIAFDRFSKEPIFNARHNIEVYKGDIFDMASVAGALFDVDYVIHSFSATTPYVSDNDPFIDIASNLSTSVAIFDLCVKNGISKVGFISSGGAVYGTAAEKGIVSEDDTPMPVSPYGINKLAIEHYLEYFKRKHGLEYVVYRLTNPYGPRQHTKKNQGVIPAFIDHVNNNEEIVVLGDGSTSRDFIYIEDAARMITESFEIKNKSKVYNIGSGQETSLNQIIDELRVLFSSKTIRVTHQDAPKTFLSKTQVSVDSYVEEFGSPDFTPLKSGLEKTIEAFK